MRNQIAILFVILSVFANPGLAESFDTIDALIESDSKAAHLFDVSVRSGGDKITAYCSQALFDELSQERYNVLRHLVGRRKSGVNPHRVERLILYRLVLPREDQCAKRDGLIMWSYERTLAVAIRKGFPESNKEWDLWLKPMRRYFPSRKSNQPVEPTPSSELPTIGTP